MSHSTVKAHWVSSRRNFKTRGKLSRSIRQHNSPPRISAAVTASAKAAETCSASAFSFSSISGSTGKVASALDLLLEKQNAIEQRLGGRRATGHVDIDRHDPIAAAHHRIGIVVVAAAIRAGAH